MKWLAAFLLSAGLLFAQSTVFVVRHADRYGTEPDPDITPEGRREAASLAKLLADAKITHIYTTELVRTQQTAAPTAKEFGVTPVIVSSERPDELIRRIRSTLRDGEATLVVGHRGSVPKIVKALTGRDVTPLKVGEYDRLEVVTLFPDGKSSVVLLRYGH
jgi:broad specificity phosphatase PhoE